MNVELWEDYATGHLHIQYGDALYAYLYVENEGFAKDARLLQDGYPPACYLKLTEEAEVETVTMAEHCRHVASLECGTVMISSDPLLGTTRAYIGEDQF